MLRGLHVVRRHIAHLDNHAVQHVLLLLQQIPIALYSVVLFDIAQRVPALPLDVVLGLFLQDTDPFEHVGNVVDPTLLYVQFRGGNVQIDHPVGRILQQVDELFREQT